MNPPIRLLLADDHAIVRLGLRAIFEFEPAVEIVAEAATAKESVDAVIQFNPDVTLLDLRMPGEGLEALRMILERSPHARVLVLTTSDLEEDMHRALAMGAAGYALKSTSPTMLVEAIQAVHAGARWIPDEVARKVAERAETEELSPREAEVLELIVKGLTNGEIASTLGISLGTAKAHLRSILAKLQVADRTEAAAQAYRRGLLR